MNLETFYLNHKHRCKQNLQKYINYIPDDAICFDIGSNMGMYSESLLELKSKAIIHLFEPVKKYHEISLQKLTKYKDRTIINNLGLSDKEESRQIYLDNKNNPGWNTYVLEQTQSEMTVEKTKLTTLDSYCRQNSINKIDFIKIDTEGYEAFVLSGFLTTLKILKNKPTLFIELGWGNKHPNWNFSLDIFNQLKSLGYSFPELEIIDKTTDILFTHSKS